MSESDGGDRTERPGDRSDAGTRAGGVGGADEEERADEGARADEGGVPDDADRGDPEGFEDAVASSSGNPLVLLGMNAVLSTAFAWIAVWGMGLLGLVEYTAVNVATAAIVLFALTYVLVLQ